MIFVGIKYIIYQVLLLIKLGWIPVWRRRPRIMVYRLRK